MQPIGKMRSIWSGYLFRFDKLPGAAYADGTGARLLFVCVLLEGLIRPSLGVALRRLGIAGDFWGVLVPVSCILVLALVLTTHWIRLPLQRIGIYRWRYWGSAERWFFPQILAISALCFIVAVQKELSAIADRPEWFETILMVFAGQMIWGFYQEYVYRGLLQTELVRRCGTWPGILASNLLFTFGPLHAYHFSRALENPWHLAIFAAIFAIGLYFSVLFLRSGNLCIVGALHGLGDFFLDGVAKLN
jgi:membrane protease YdiL (CAAX protease family)